MLSVLTERRVYHPYGLDGNYVHTSYVLVHRHCLKTVVELQEEVMAAREEIP